METNNSTNWRRRLWAGRILTGLFALFMLLDAAAHIAKPQQVVSAFDQLGVPLRLAVGLGIMVLLCVALYLMPATAFLGALLLTAYLGGAVMVHARVGDPIFPTLFPALLGILMWVGLLLRFPKLQELATDL